MSAARASSSTSDGVGTSVGTSVDVVVMGAFLEEAFASGREV